MIDQHAPQGQARIPAQRGPYGAPQQAWPPGAPQQPHRGQPPMPQPPVPAQPAMPQSPMPQSSMPPQPWQPGLPDLPAGLQQPLPATPQRRIGLVVGIVAGVLVLLAGAVGAALWVFGARTIDEQRVQQEIVRITRDATQVAPVDVRCPADVEARAGSSFTCTATLDGQPITYTVRMTDGDGSVSITGERTLGQRDVEQAGARQIGQRLGIPVTLSCGPRGRTVIVNAPGTPIPCVAARVSDPSDTANFTVSVSEDEQISVSYAG